MLNKQTTLYLYRGATSSIEIDFTNFDFKGGKCVFSISPICKKEILYQLEFDESVKYTIIIPDEFTSTLLDNKYLYNIMLEINDERYPQCADSDIIVRDVVNAYEQ